MLATCKTPEARNRQTLDDAVALIIVHSDSQYDPKAVSKDPAETLISKLGADYIWEFSAFHESYVKHTGEIIDNTRKSGEYHIDNLAGTDYVLVGGGLNGCHFGAYVSLLANRYTKQADIHLAKDAIYYTYNDVYDGEVEKTTKLVCNLPDSLGIVDDPFQKYKNLLKIMQNSYEIREDNRIIEGAAGRNTRLMIWSSSDIMLNYIDGIKNEEDG